MKLFNIAKNRPTHGARLERWLGKEQVLEISNSMKDWYGPPIAVAGVPGNVWALPGGDFGGIIKSGQFLSAVDYAAMRMDKLIQKVGLKSRQQCNAGFSSLSDLIASATSGKRIEFIFSKTPTGSPSTNQSATYWNAAGTPSAGGAGSAAPGGRATDSTTTGAMPFANPGGTDTLHFVTGYMSSSIANGTVLLYDRIFDVAKTMSSIATEAVTGVPTRYQSNTPTDPDFAGGNFCFPEISATLGAGAHNWTTCLYRNQAGTDNQTFDSESGISGAAGRIDLASGWFLGLQSGDYGVADLAQMQSSASFTGGINFVIGHPIAFMPCPIANLTCILDGINTSFNLVRIFNDACLTFLWINSPGVGAGTIRGNITTVYG